MGDRLVSSVHHPLSLSEDLRACDLDTSHPVCRRGCLVADFRVTFSASDKCILKPVNNDATHVVVGSPIEEAAAAIQESAIGGNALASRPGSLLDPRALDCE